MTEPGRLIASVERAADVLILFTRIDSPEIGVTEIASQLSLSKAVVHRILTTLASRGLVESSDTTRRYRLGPVALSLGVTYSNRIDLHSLTMPVLHRLSGRTQETATYSLRYGWERIYVDQVTPDREVRMTVALGRSFPLHAGASSKAFLAFLPAEEQQQYLERGNLTALSSVTVTDPERLRADLAEIRKRGYAISYGERQPGTGSVAAPVLNQHGVPAAVISVCGPIERVQEVVPRIALVLLDETRGLSRQLGFNAASS